MRYVPYIKDEKVNMQCLLSGMPKSFKDRIDFDEPKIGGYCPKGKVLLQVIQAQRRTS
jgi:hypothetical protein